MINIKPLFNRVRHLNYKKLISRNAIFIELLTLAIILGIFIGTAFGSGPLTSTNSLQILKPIPTTTTTTSTTTTTMPPTTTTTTTTKPYIAPATTKPYIAPEIIATDVRVPTESQQYWLGILRDCETHSNYQSNTGNSYYGAYQFSYSTWKSMNTGYEYAYQAPPEVQDNATLKLVARAGSHSQFPGCTKSRGIPNKF